MLKKIKLNSKVNEQKIYLIICIFMFVVISCSKNSGSQNTKNTGYQNNNDVNKLETFLKSLPKKEDTNAESPYNELSMFLNGRNKIIAGKYKDGFDVLAKFLDLYPSTFYESEANYLLGQAVVYMVQTEPNYIEEYYTKLNNDRSKSEEENFNDSQPNIFSIKDVYSKLGITVRNDVYSFNGAPFSRIARDTSGNFPLKDFAYYLSIKHRFSKISTEDDKYKFITNVDLLLQFSDRYRTSFLQEPIIETYFTNTLPFKLTPAENKKYRDTLKTVEERIKDIKPGLNENMYVNGNGIIIRDRIPMPGVLGEKELYVLNNYDFVTVLKETNIYNRRDRETNSFYLVSYNTFYGPVIGWSYARYFGSINSLDESTKKIFEIYKQAMAEYNSYNYLEAAELFSQVLSRTNINYFTDKSAYFLWRLNNKIGELVSSKESEYYKYVTSYPKYFYYNESTSTLHSSTLLYNYIVKILPDSQYKFKISGDSETEYSVD